MSKSPCRIHCLGIHSALGNGIFETTQTLFSDDPQTLVSAQVVYPELSAEMTSRWGLLGQVPEPLAQIPDQCRTLRSRNGALLLTAFAQIEPQVLELRQKFGADRIGVVVASSTSGIATGEAAIQEFVITGSLPKDYNYLQQEMGAAADIIARAGGLSGPTYMVSTACSSSAKVFASGRSLLETGLCDAVIIGGADTLCRMTLDGFASLELLSPIRTNPFSKNRRGLSLGEGAALFILTKDSGGVQLLGVGESSDAYHISSPDPEGSGAVQALRAAIDDAGVQTSDISYLNLHGTGTPANDAMEAKALRAVFGKHAENDLFVSSTKPLTGHTLGACGAIENAICYLMLDTLLRDHAARLLPLPVHHYDGDYDSEIPALNLVDKPSSLRRTKQAFCASNSFGFGGSNCTVILGAEL